MNLFLRISICLTALVVFGISSVLCYYGERQQRIKELVLQLASEDQDEQIEAFDALMNPETKKFIPYITKLLQDNDLRICCSAIWVLGDLGAKEAIPGITKLLQHSNPLIRESAVRGLSHLGAKEAIPEITKLLQDSDPDVREAARAALKELEKK
jgi:HEAT repeat protein